MVYKYWESKKIPAKGTIVFIHGFAVNSDYFDNIAKKLNEEYNYYALELPGMGRTEVKDKKDLCPYRYAELISEWLVEKNLENIILIGHSMGGGTVNLVGSLVPERLSKIICICPMSSVITPRLAVNARQILQYTPKKAYKKAHVITKHIDKKYPNKELDPALIEFVEYNKKNKKNFKILFKNMSSLVKNIVKLHKVEKDISVPTLLITGDEDQIIHSHKTAEKLTKNENVTWVEIKDTGHVPFEEQEAETLKAILDYIQK